MDTEKVIRYRSLLRAGLIIATAFVFVLFSEKAVKASIKVTYYASDLENNTLWEFKYGEDAITTLILDRDCEIQGIHHELSDWEYIGTFIIIGNGHKMKVGSAGIDVGTSSLIIEDAIIEIDTTQKYAGSYQYGISTNSDYSVKLSRCNLDIKTLSRAIGGGNTILSECAVESGSVGGKNVSIRATNSIENVKITVTEPKAGEKAKLNCSVDDNNIIVSRMLNNDKGVTWSEGEKEYGLGQDCIFQVGHTYRCTAGISAKIGKVTSATKVKINGHDATFKEMKSEHAYFYYDFELEPDTPVKKDEATKQDKDVVADSASLITDKTGTYSVQNNEATFTAPAKKTAKTVTVPATIKAGGKTVKVTAIAPNALKGMKKLTKVTIGSNVTTIGKNAFANDAKLTTVTIGKNVKSIGAKAFYKCKALKKITIKTKKLTKKTVGSKAFTGINKKAVIKSPKAKKAAYKKILLKKGMKKTMTFK